MKGIEVRENSIRLQFTDQHGMRHRQSFKAGQLVLPPTPANQKAAARMMEQIHASIRIGTFDLQTYFPDEASSAPDKTTVAQQLDIWFAGLRVATSTRRGYSAGVNFWKEAPSGESGPKIGDLALQSLLHSHARHALASRPKLKAKTINNYLGVLRAAIGLAVFDEALKSNPTGSGKTLRAKVQKELPDPFSRDEIERVLEDIAKHYPAAVHNYATFWAYTGMRTSEINGLEWDDVDFASSHVAVTHVNVRGERKETTKNSQARNLLMNSRALAALKAQKEHTWLRGGPVFRHPVEDTPWNDELAFRRSYWTRSLKRLGMRYRRPYQMRHTYACQLLMAGVQVGYCAQIMGHSTETFLRTYSKWINSDRDKAEMARLETAMAADVARGRNQAEAA